MEGLCVGAPGGLLEAKNGKFRDAINVSIPLSGSGFGSLLVEPDLKTIMGDHFPLTSILQLLKLWSEARVLGPLVTLRRNRVVDRIANRLFARLCGERGQCRDRLPFKLALRQVRSRRSS